MIATMMLRHQALQLSQQMAAGQRVRIGAASYRLIGVFLWVCALLPTSAIVSEKGQPNSPPAFLFGGSLAPIFLIWLGWSFITSCIYVDAGGIEVRNPVNTATIPWAKVTDVSAGSWLRIHTARWRIGVFGIEKPNIQSVATSGVQAVADALMVQVHRHRADSTPPPAIQARKRWGPPGDDLVLLAALVATSALYCFT